MLVFISLIAGFSATDAQAQVQEVIPQWVQDGLPIGGVVLALTIWLRQYWLQQRLTGDIVKDLREELSSLKKENAKLSRENTLLRARADQDDIKLLEALAAEEEGTD